MCRLLRDSGLDVTLNTLIYLSLKFYSCKVEIRKLPTSKNFYDDNMNSKLLDWSKDCQRDLWKAGREKLLNAVSNLGNT